MYRNFIKVLGDYVIAIVLLVLLSPIFITITIILIVANGGSPFFLQRRPGKGEKIFTIIKFRTMNNARDKDGQLLPDKDRLTSVGRFVRSTSLDEIPQLLNVVTGAMSIVGPRPLLPEYLPLYNDFQKQRHLVKPGITGWAQDNGRNALSWEEKFELDIDYVKKVSFALDCRILAKTIVKVFKRSDINNAAAATMEPFKGSEKT